MALSSIAGKPGTQAAYTATPIDVFYADRDKARFIPGPVTVDGTALTGSSNPLNTPYVNLLQAGMLMGKNSTSGKYITAVFGKTIGAYTSGGTSLTVSAAAALYIKNRIGATGTAKIAVVGPPTAAGTVAVTSVTHSAVDTTTGILTVSSLGVDKVTDSLVVALDGSDTPLTVLCDQWGTAIVTGTATTATNVDVFDCELWAGGGIMDASKILNWPADTSTQAWIKAQIRLIVPGAMFKDDLINS